MTLTFDNSAYRPATHEDFENDFNDKYSIGKWTRVRVPGGWLITGYAGSSVGAGVAITSCFIPFPEKFVLKKAAKNE